MTNDNTVTAEEVRRVSPIVSGRPHELLWTFLTGAGVGLVVSLFTYLLQTYVFSALLCAEPSNAGCENSASYSLVIAMVLGAIGGLISLTTMQVYRPLLVVLAATISLWGYTAILGGIAWYWGVLIAMVLFGLAYALFSWLVRIRSFLLAVVIMIVIVVIVRLVLS